MLDGVAESAPRVVPADLKAALPREAEGRGRERRRMASQHMLKVAGIWKLVVGFGAHNTRRIPDTRYPIPGTRDGILPFIPFAAVALPRMVAQ